MKYTKFHYGVVAVINTGKVKYQYKKLYKHYSSIIIKESGICWKPYGTNTACFMKYEDLASNVEKNCLIINMKHNNKIGITFYMNSVDANKINDIIAKRNISQALLYR